MSTKKRINALINKTARFTAGHFNLLDSDDVTQEHVDFAYTVLWANDKLNVELHSDESKIKRAIQSAIDEWNIAYSEGGQYEINRM